MNKLPKRESSYFHVVLNKLNNTAVVYLSKMFQLKALLSKYFPTLSYTLTCEISTPSYI